MTQTFRRKNVVLTGFMGTGKTTTGRILAHLLDYEFVDTDRLIESRHGSITEIFRSQGEEVFRELERELAEELAGGEGLVISTGGRMMLDPVSADSLGTGAHVFCLVALPETILDRVSDSPVERPLLSVEDPLSRIEELLAERREGYGRFPQIDTDGRSPRQVAEELVLLVRPGCL